MLQSFQMKFLLKKTRKFNVVSCSCSKCYKLEGLDSSLLLISSLFKADFGASCLNVFLDLRSVLPVFLNTFCLSSQDLPLHAYIPGFVFLGDFWSFCHLTKAPFGEDVFSIGFFLANPSCSML